MKRKLIYLALSMAIVATAFVGCGSDSETGEEETGSAETGGEDADSAGEEEITIAGVVFQDDEFMTMLTNGMVDAAEEEGVKINTANTNSDQSKEVELINTYITQGLDGICIAPLDPETSIATLKTATEAGIPVTTVNMELTDVDFLTGGYSSDDYANGELIGAVAAEYIKENYDRPVKIAIIDFDHQVPAQSKNRYGGFLAGLDDAEVEYEIVGQQSAEKEDTALIAADGILAASPDVDIFYGANSGGLIGAVSAIKQSDSADTCVAFGYDGNDVITTLLTDDSNVLQGVVVQDPYTQGYEAAKLLIQSIRGEVEASGKTEAVPGQILQRGDDEAIKQYRIDNGFD